VRIAIDARAAAEVPAGRGRYVRELLLGLGRLDADHDYRLVARSPWREGGLDGRFSWEIVGAAGLRWPLAAGRRMSQVADVALACTSYAVTAPWRIPGAAIVYDFVAFDRRLHPPRGALLERLTLPVALRRCGALIAISETTRRELVERFPSAAPRASVAAAAAAGAYSPQPGADDEAILARHGLRRPYVLIAGTLEPRKNVARVIEAFARVEPSLRKGWKLAIAGGAGWGDAGPAAALAQHGDLARMLGFVPERDLPCLYRHAELVCYLSLYEGFGLPVLEALQSGTAVLTSSVSSMPEVGGSAAFYADPRDVGDITRALSELLADPGLRERGAAAGPAQAARFDWTASARHVLEVLEGLGRSG
jgi:alpha-1,3-rhamnosyl/mannosyltransferase